MPAGTPVGGAPAGVPAEGPALTIKFGAACGVRCGSGYLSTLSLKPQGPLLAGNIVQVRLERKALSAAVSPTCCSGREQRSKTAHAGSAIPYEDRIAQTIARRAPPHAGGGIQPPLAAGGQERLTPSRLRRRQACRGVSTL